MKKFVNWIFVVILLVIILSIRIFVRTYNTTKFLFKKQNVYKIEFKDIDNKDIVLKKEQNNWFVSTSTGTYPADKEKLKLISEKLDKFELLELISKKPSSYEDYQLNNSSATKIKVYYNKNKSTTIWFGKTGGFTYNECYVRIDEKPYIYLARGITAEDFTNQFYHYCSRTVLKSDIDKISYINIKVNNKTYEFKKELENGTTIWVNLKTLKPVDSNKVSDYLKNFNNFVADVIIEPTDYDLTKLTKSISEIILKYEDNTEVLMYVYDKLTVKIRSKWSTDIMQLYPIRIKCLTSKGSSIETIADENTTFCIYDFRYENLKSQPGNF
jgi:hypothetical protein